MFEQYSIGGFGLRGEGMTVALFLMGLFMRLVHVEIALGAYTVPVGDITMVFSACLLAIDKIIVLQDKSRKAKRFGL